MTRASTHGMMRRRGEDQLDDREQARLTHKLELGQTPPVIKEGANDRD